VVGNIAIRGDAKPAPAKVFTDANTELHRLGNVFYSASGSTNSTYENCNKMTAELSPIEIDITKISGMRDLSGKTHFQGYKKILPNGFDLYLDFQGWEVISKTVTTVYCNGGTNVFRNKWSSQMIGLDGHDAIPLRFEEGTELIKADSITERVYNSTQLIWDFEEGEKHGRTASLSWKSFRFPEK
jgi:hypothetical protein